MVICGPTLILSSFFFFPTHSTVVVSGSIVFRSNSILLSHHQPISFIATFRLPDTTSIFRAHPISPTTIATSLAGIFLRLAAQNLFGFGRRAKLHGWRSWTSASSSVALRYDYQKSPSPLAAQVTQSAPAGAWV